MKTDTKYGVRYADAWEIQEFDTLVEAEASLRTDVDASSYPVDIVKIITVATYTRKPRD